MATVVSSNPALKSDAAQELLHQPAERTMTVAGVSFKTLVFLALVIIAGLWGWASATEPVATDTGGGYGTTTVTLPGGFWLAVLGAFVVGIFASINPRLAGILGAIYALLQGYVLGAISAAFDAQTEGIVGAAILGTVCVFVVALLLYITRIVRPTQKMAFGVIAGIGGLALLYFIVWILAIFDVSFLYSEEFRAVGIVVTIIAIVLAALSLTLDFASIEGLVAAGAPRYMEWYMAYSLMVTLIWLYIELLRLLALLARNQ
jgi:uncharacterized YccA/Bax inhibitor family protein